MNVGLTKRWSYCGSVRIPGMRPISFQLPFSLRAQSATINCVGLDWRECDVIDCLFRPSNCLYRVDSYYNRLVTYLEVKDGTDCSQMCSLELTIKLNSRQRPIRPPQSHVSTCTGSKRIDTTERVSRNRPTQLR